MTGDKPSLTEEQRLAIEAVQFTQKQYEAVIERMQDYKTLFRDDRDAAVRKALDLKVPKALIAVELKVSTVWLNKLLRGEAYHRRSTDEN